MGLLQPCPSCGLKSLPIHAQCAFCAKPVRDPGDAARERETWEATDPGIRRDALGEHERDLAELRGWKETLDRRRPLHAAVGAALFGGPISFIFLFWWKTSGVAWIAFTILALAAGAAAGYSLNRFGGGPRRGVAICVAAFVAMFGLTLGARAVDMPLADSMIRFTWLSLAYGSLFSVAAGYVLGGYLVTERRRG